MLAVYAADPVPVSATDRGFCFDPSELLIGEGIHNDPATGAPPSAVYSRGVSLGMMTMRRVAESAGAAHCRVNRHFVAVCAVAMAWRVPAAIEPALPVVMDKRMSAGRGAHRMTVWAIPRFWRHVDARCAETDESLSAAMRALWASGRILADRGATSGMTVPWLYEPWGYHEDSARQRRYQKRKAAGVTT